MDIALWGVLIGFTLGIIYKVVDLLTLRREEQRQAEEHARSRAELDARWQEIEERHRRIATILDNLPTTRRKRELADTAERAASEGRYDEAIAAATELLALESDPERRTALLAMPMELRRHLSNFDTMTGLIRRDRLAHFVNNLTSDPALGKWVHFSLLHLESLKEVHDTLGHVSGDELVRVAAETLKKIASDTSANVACSHWGGGEFAMVSVSHSQRDGLELAKRVREEVELAANKWLATKSELVRTTVAAGQCTVSRESVSYDLLIRAADRAVQKAKGTERGRLAVESAEHES